MACVMPHAGYPGHYHPVQNSLDRSNDLLLIKASLAEMVVADLLSNRIADLDPMQERNTYGGTTGHPW